MVTLYECDEGAQSREIAEGSSLALAFTDSDIVLVEDNVSKHGIVIEDIYV